MNGSEAPLARAIRGPVTLITVGVLFALNNFTPYSFDKTWPVILIVFGLLSLLRRGTEPAYTPPPQYPYPPPPPTPYPLQPQVYNTPPVPAATPPGRGGFGSSAPQRTSDTAPKPAPPQGEGGSL